jgi:hypothetical protein
MRFSIVLAAAAPLLANAAPVVTRAASNANVAVLQFAELLEQLEAQFYTQALQKFVAQDFINAGISVPDVAIQTFQDILNHESAHVSFLDTALSDNGASPLTDCSFNFGPVLTDVATMASVARVVEHVGVGAYLGGADIIDDKNFLAAAATILTVEARHQSFLNILAGATAIPQAFDVALTPADVLSIAGSFISGCDPATEIGLPPGNPPLAVTNSGPITPGTQLQFSSPALNSTTQSNTFCQMLVGGQTDALSFPIDQCIVPGGINGPVWIYLTNDPQPLAADIHIRASVNIIAGPTAAFLDTESNALGALVRTGGSGFNSSEVISPSQAQSQLEGATTLLPTGTTDVPVNVAPTPDPSAQVTSAPALATGTVVAALSVLGVSSIPASSA